MRWPTFAPASGQWGASVGWSWTGALLGLAFGGGIALVTAYVRARRPSLEARVAPHIGAGLVTTRRSRWEAALGGANGPLVARGARLLEKLGSTRSSVEFRLGQLGDQRSCEQFRVEQLAWAALALLLGSAGALAAVVWLALPWPLGMAGVVVTTLLGALARDAALTRAARRRVTQLQAEIPDLSELVALAVAAGESLSAALARVAQTGSGPLAQELGSVAAQVRAGTPLAQALRQLIERLRLPALTRFVETALAALERGSPLAEVLRAQAQDAREESRRELIESGGKREIAMMVPVIFLILPVTILFALYPGIAVLQLGP
ncbi:MAG: type II secretion system F family protein [Buchananella hordeovulneris]|nr:type II secretion system F family protein [Buchananella hordeovulneris]